MTSKPVLEPAAQQFADATANPPFLSDLGPEKGREAVDHVQSGDIAKPTGLHQRKNFRDNRENFQAVIVQVYRS